MAEHEHPELPPEVDFYEAEETRASVGYLEAANDEDRALAVFRKLMHLIDEDQKLASKQPAGFRPPPTPEPVPEPAPAGRARKKATPSKTKRRAVQHKQPQKKQPRRAK